ncbi:MAG: hypothetical protein ACYC5U_10790, partial [Rhodocyclaceae bacterium]
RQARRRGRKPAAGYALRRFPPPAKKRTIQKLQNRTGLKTRDRGCISPRRHELLQLKIQPSQFAFTPRNLYKQVHDYFYDARIRPIDIIVAIKRHDLTPMFIPSRMEYWLDIG